MKIILNLGDRFQHNVATIEKSQVITNFFVCIFCTKGDRFKTRIDYNGNLITTWGENPEENGNLLDAPWRVAIAPADFGEFSNALFFNIEVVL